MTGHDIMLLPVHVGRHDAAMWCDVMYNVHCQLHDIVAIDNNRQRANINGRYNVIIAMIEQCLAGTWHSRLKLNVHVVYRYNHGPNGIVI